MAWEAGLGSEYAAGSEGEEAMLNCRSALLAPIFVAALAVGQPAAAADVSLALKYGVLAGLTGDPAPSGQGWNEAARLAIDQAAATLKSLNLTGISVELADSQDSQGNAQAGVEAAQKLVQIDRVNVIIGDFYSSVTSAAATAVAIPNNVLMFTGGTSPALTKLNTGPTPIVWQPVAADDVQGRVLARIVADALGKTDQRRRAQRRLWHQPVRGVQGSLARRWRHDPQIRHLQSSAADARQRGSGARAG
jgi:branched-chain amino acid transport system substrate-binding protein